MELRLREYTPAGVRGKVIATVSDSISVADVENGTATLSFAVSTAKAGTFESPFVVGVEYSADGIVWAPLSRNNLFIVSENSGDDADTSKTVTYEGENYFSWLAARGQIWWYGTYTGDERTFGKGADVSAGQMLHSDLLTNQSSGWAPHHTFSFTAAQDSKGQAWQSGEKIRDHKVKLPLQTLRFIQQLTDMGLCEWDTTGMAFNLYRPGTTRDRTDVVLKHAAERVPVKVDTSNMHTTLVLVPSEGGRHVVPVPDADMRFGKLDGVVTLDGVTNQASALKAAQPYLELAKRPTREEAYEWSPRPGDYVPWKHFQVGDTVTAVARGGRRERRVIALVVREQGGSVTVQARVGERINSPAVRQARRLASVSTGGFAGGTGASFSPSVGRGPLLPDRPNGLSVLSNTAVWLEDFTAQATVDLSWAAVTHATDGSEIDVAFYELHSRLLHESASLDTTVTGTSVSVASWTPGVTRAVSVVAVSSRGERSLPSLELEVTPAVPASVVPKAPTGLTVASNVGAFTPAGPVAAVKLDWAAVTQSTDDEAIVVAEYIVLVDGFEHTRTSGLTVTVTVPSDAVRGIRVIAVTGQGVQGDPSALVNVTGAKPVLVSRVPSTPTFKTGFGSLITVWDGVYTTGGTAGAHSVRVEARVGTSGAFTVQGTLTGAGEQLISLGEVDDTVQVRFIAVDALGRDTGTSATASGTRVGVKRADLDAAVDEFLDDLDELAGNAWNAASVAVINTVVEYAVGSSETVAPSTGWSTATPTRTPGSFIWMRTIVTKGDDTTSTTSPVLVTGNAGAAGSPGRSITDVDVMYYLSTSATAQTGGSWVTSPPAWVDGRYMWTKTVTTYSTGSPSETDPVNITGSKGSTGTAGKGISSTVVNYAASTSGTATPSTGWQSTVPTVAKGSYLWTRTVITYTDAATSTMYAVARMGVDGIDGNDGVDGDDGRGVASIVEEYYLSTSSSTQAGGSWGTSVPAWVDGRFYWTRSKITYTDSAVVTTTPKMVSGGKGATGGTGTSVTSVTPYFQLAASSPAKPTASPPPAPWQTTEPAYSAALKLWTVTRVTYSNSTFAYTDVSEVGAYAAAVLADGKLTLASANPTTGNGAGKPVGALWMTKTGTAFSSMWEWSGTAWAQRPLSETIIPLIAIGAGTYGELSGGRLSARSISALKLALGDFTNLVNDGSFANGNIEWAGQTVITSTTEPNCMEVVTAASGNNDKNNSAFFESWQGAEYYAEFEVWADPANTAFRNANLWVSSVNDAGTNVAWPSVSVLAATLQANPGTWIKAAGVITHAHTATRQARIAVSVSQGTPGVAGQKYRFRNLQVRRRNTAELLVDGSVSARTLDVDEAFADKIFGNEAAFGKVNVDHLAPNVGENLNISANGTINMIAGRQNAQDEAIADAQALAEQAETEAQTGIGLASTASAKADLAAGAVLVAQALAEQVNQALNTHKTVFIVDEHGAVIAAVDRTNELRMRSTYIAMAQNGVEVTRWEGNRMIVNEAVLNTARIASIRFEAYEGGTVIRQV